MSDLKTAVVSIGRRENLYAREFVEWYKKLGFSNVIILDNNYDGEEHFEEVLQDYIDEGFVIIEDYRNQIKAQMRGYTTEYNKIKDKYDAVLLVDFDEFLVLEHDKTISEYISRFPNDWQAILINWLIMTDNNQIHYEPKPLNERFTEVMDVMKCVQYQFPDDMHIKSLIRGGMDRINFCGNPHTTDTPLIAYNASGVRCENRPWQPMNFDKAYLKHFTTKSLSEYCENKLVKGTADRPYDVFLKTYVNRYFKINDVTQEKLNWLKEHGYNGV